MFCVHHIGGLRQFSSRHRCCVERVLFFKVAQRESCGPSVETRSEGTPLLVLYTYSSKEKDKRKM
jgi:hypothetical protein